jgi:hypothetical protein
MKLTKQRLKEIIKEELVEADEASCDPEEDLDFVGILDAAILAVGDEELASQLGCLKQRIIPQSEYDEDEPEPEKTTRTPIGYGGDDWEPTLGFRESIRQMVREALGSLSEPEEEYPKNWVIRRHGFTDDESYLTKDLRRNPWGSLEQAERHEFKEMAKGVRLAATRLAADGPYIIDGIEGAKIVDLSEPEEPEESGDKGPLLPKVDRAMLDRLQKGLQTGDWRK